MIGVAYRRPGDVFIVKRPGQPEDGARVVLRRLWKQGPRWAAEYLDGPWQGQIVGLDQSEMIRP